MRTKEMASNRSPSRRAVALSCARKKKTDTNRGAKSGQRRWRLTIMHWKSFYPFPSLLSLHSKPLSAPFDQTKLPADEIRKDSPAGHFCLSLFSAFSSAKRKTVSEAPCTCLVNNYELCIMNQSCPIPRQNRRFQGVFERKVPWFFKAPFLCVEIDTIKSRNKKKDSTPPR